MPARKARARRAYPLVSVRISETTDAHLKRLCGPRERSKVVATVLETVLTARHWRDRAELLATIQRRAAIFASADEEERLPLDLELPLGMVRTASRLPQ